MYIPLHVHYVKGSIGDSVLVTKDAVKKAKNLGMPALAITDHGSMANVIEFYKECNKQGIKPIIGMEAYEATDRLDKTKREEFHTILLPKNAQGYKDLLHINADAQFNGYYYKPRTDMSVLEKYGSNLIGTSACLGGKIPTMITELLETNDNEIINEKYNEIFNAINEYKECLADFYLEIQPGNFEQQIEMNKLLVELAQETNTKLIITNDVHYLNSEDYIIHDQHVKMERKLSDDSPMIYPDKIYYLMGYDEIRDMFPYLDDDIVEEALKNTVNVANEIDLSDLYDGKIKMPKANVPDGYTEDEYLEKITIDKLNKISYRLKDPSVYYDRAKYELDTLKEVGFSGYLLVIKEFYDYAKSHNIPIGPGRGSIGGSIVAYLIGLTKIDSIKYNLMFERFISKYRKGSVPDIDTDSASSKRLELFKYAIEKFGWDCCALVSTFALRKARSAVRDTARIFNIDLELADRAAKLIPKVYYDDLDGEKMTDLSIEESLNISEELRQIKSEHEDWFEAAMKLEDLPSHTSIHAAGTLISPIPLMDFVPLIRNSKKSKNDDEEENIEMMATALALEDAEFSGAIKYDFLGLFTLDITSATEEDTGFIPDFDDDDWLNDEETWNLIGSKNTTTLFQIGTDTYKKRMYRLKPRTIPELAACLALVRGPCISSKLDEDYMQIIEGKKEVELIHPFYDSVTERTNGILLFQEQMIEVLINFGFEPEKSFKIMKYASKKNKQKELEASEVEFRKHASDNNVSKEIADRIWAIMVNLGKYCFNESHAVAYALLCYYTAYLKVHYPMEWMRNALSNVYRKKGKKEERLNLIQQTVQECRRLGINFLSLDINKSDWKFTIEDNKLRIGYCAAKGVGEVAYEELNSKRPFISLEDVVSKVTGKFNKRAFLISIYGGAFEEFGDKQTLHELYCQKRKEEASKEITIAKNATFNIDDSNQEIENAIFGTPLISNPVQTFEYFDFDSLKERQVIKLQAIVKKTKKIKDRNQNDMAFLTLETSSGYIEATVFNKNYKGNTKYMKNNLIIYIKAKKNKDSFIVEEFIS
jgi:DNA polymerase-3 subunit alpha